MCSTDGHQNLTVMGTEAMWPHYDSAHCRASSMRRKSMGLGASVNMFCMLDRVGPYLPDLSFSSFTCGAKKLM